MKVLPLIIAGVVAVAATTPALNAASKKADDARTYLSTLRVAELPREVAKLIVNEKGNGRAERCVAIVRSAVELSRASAPAIVGAASRIAPDLAPEFSAAAATIEPKLAAGIARAAAAAAPNYAPEIAVAVIKAQPSQYTQVAYEVAYAVPAKDQQVVNAVVTGLPNLKPFTASTPNLSVSELLATAPDVEKAASQIGMKTEQFLVADLTPVQVSTVQTAALSASAGKVSAAGVTKGTPFVPGAGTPGEVNRAQTVVVTPGQGRTYDKPGNGPKDKNDDGKPGNGPKS